MMRIFSLLLLSSFACAMDAPESLQEWEGTLELISTQIVDGWNNVDRSQPDPHIVGKYKPIVSKPWFRFTPDNTSQEPIEFTISWDVVRELKENESFEYQLNKNTVLKAKLTTMLIANIKRYTQSY